MRAGWSIDQGELNRWSNLVAETEQKALVVRRKRRNVHRKDIDLSKQSIWHVLVGCQVTTQQRSGPNSPVSLFLKSKSPALRYSVCSSTGRAQALIETECRAAGLRRAPTIAENLATILAKLEAGEWKILRSHLSTLESNTTLGKERFVAAYLQSPIYPGLGQKQSRNLIQWLGLSRYEIPLDSRVLKKLRELGSNFVPSGSALTDPVVYEFVQDGLQQIAKALGIYPCVLDACIFSSFDESEGEEADDA